MTEAADTGPGLLYEDPTVHARRWTLPGVLCLSLARSRRERAAEAAT